jgi:hypothetical protein
MNNAHVTTEAPISTRSGMTGDLADFAIATFRNARVGNLAGLPTVRPQIAFFGEPTPALADLPPSLAFAMPEPVSASVTAITFLEPLATSFADQRQRGAE